ncbi:MAG: BatA domain-containing protein [Gemmatimonadaceae bacterium]|jgi:hypothetical protein|nr:BatA domain-containing protein [Gemmatimonadaceae bacterium]MCU0627194.1 BatA domain-containing protein [Gemmatimonadaceae bacterium]
MTWLAPALVAAAGVAIGATVVAHLFARRRPTAVPIATTRFLPAGEFDARTLTRRPRDPWLLALRLLVLALLGAGAAQPVPDGGRTAVRQVVVLDATLAAPVADSVLRALDPRDLVLVADTGGRALPAEVMRAAGPWRPTAQARLGGALVLLARLRDSLARSADSLAVTVVSPWATTVVDAGTPTIRALLPFPLRTVRAAGAVATGDSVRAPVRVDADADDPVGAALVLLAAQPGGARVRVVRTAAPDRDDATTVVRWAPAPGDARPVLDGVRLADGSAWVAPLARLPMVPRAGDVAIAHWRDGAVAAVERRTATGRCERVVGIGLPAAGDVALTVEARHAIAMLVRPCDLAAPTLDDATLAALAAAPAPLPGGVRAALTHEQRSSWAPWLVGAAVVLAALEPLLRGRLAAPVPVTRDA